MVPGAFFSGTGGEGRENENEREARAGIEEAGAGEVKRNGGKILDQIPTANRTKNST